ncbi:MAG: hypothetical protein HYS40_07650 [Gemmatimonadetes bacterium]|nr:hypothetical protein [Gemmatimonadota bacterium]
MGRRVYLAAQDLLFRSKLGAVVAAAGGEVTKDETACDLAVVDIESAEADERIRTFVGWGIPVLAFGSHVKADVLRAARETGAVAVPNSQVEGRLREMLR